MISISRLVFAFLAMCISPVLVEGGGGITPEQIYQANLDWKKLIGTWEVLPDRNPLAENSKRNPGRPTRILMTLRKDGTCRIFNKDYPAGSDGLWTIENHQLSISFPDASLIRYYVYGVKGDFMITGASAKNSRDKLWSRVK